MENILIAILFTYPGAFAEFFYTQLAKGKSFYRQPDTIFRVARDCFLSVAISYAVMATAARGIQLKHWVDWLHSTRHLVWFMTGTLIGSGAAGVIWYLTACFARWFLNLFRPRMDLPTETKYYSTWTQMYYDKNRNRRDCVIEIRRNGQRAVAGIAKYTPDDLERDCGIVLVKCKEVEEYLDQYGYFSLDIMHYYDVKTGTEIIMHGAKDYVKWWKNATSSAVEAEQAAAAAVEEEASQGVAQDG